MFRSIGSRFRTLSINSHAHVCPFWKVFSEWILRAVFKSAASSLQKKVPPSLDKQYFSHCKSITIGLERISSMSFSRTWNFLQKGYSRKVFKVLDNFLAEAEKKPGSSGEGDAGLNGAANGAEHNGISNGSHRDKSHDDAPKGESLTDSKKMSKEKENKKEIAAELFGVKTKFLPYNDQRFSVSRGRQYRFLFP